MFERDWSVNHQPTKEKRGDRLSKGERLVEQKDNAGFIKISGQF